MNKIGWQVMNRIGWQERFKDDVEGRQVCLLQYIEDGGGWRVETTQAGEEIIHVASYTWPAIMEGHHQIAIDADTADDLESLLHEAGFSQSGAKEIGRHARIP